MDNTQVSDNKIYTFGVQAQFALDHTGAVLPFFISVYPALIAASVGKDGEAVK
jgi:hypothetical protein